MDRTELKKQNRFVIVSKDADFHQRSFLYGNPPKVVWIRRGNCSTATVESILRAYQDDLVKFAESEQGSFLALL
jgi:predicted nuclease of predicted toxin-antitoxin system